MATATSVRAVRARAFQIGLACCVINTILGAGQPVIELRFQPVQQFPGQDHVGLRVTVPLRDKPARLITREHA